ncbi:HSP70 family member 1, partial [Caligus rogercresseyi]
QPLGSACSDCRLGVDCPATKALLDAKDFVTLKAGFTLCGFSGRNPKFCCPPPHDLGTLRNAASGEEDYDYDGDYQLRDINIQGSVKSDNNPRESLFTNDRCGYSEPTRIRHGNDAGTHEHPWNVALLYKNASMNGRVLCGGVLLSETEALTAAHCVRDFKGFLLTSILVGHAEIGQAMEVNLTGVTLHPSYTRAPLIINDIAILHFDPLQLDSEKIKIICLPLKGSFSREDESGVVSGWGVTEESLFSENLQRLDVELVSSEKCEEDYQGKQSSFSLESSQICASGLKEDSDSCSGDSGSPLLYYEPLEGRAVLLGITSFGTRKMSVVGIDFGNENCYISVARAGGIESIANDYSMRDTPSYVAFGDKQRLMGVSAKSQHLTNLRKTFFGFKPLIGRKFQDPVVQRELPRIPYPISEDPETGNVLLHVEYLGKSQGFTPKQVTAMLFSKLKSTAENALNTKVKDVVISVPAYYNDCERRCLLDAASMADLNVLKLMNDTTATALAYGIYKQDLPAPEEKARNVVFVDVGHRGAQAAAVSFNKGKLSLVANTFDPNLGGRNLNENIAHYFSDAFKTSYKIDVRSNPKAMLKLITEVEKLKKQMSANTNKLPLNIECFMNDKDVKGYVDRTTFEEISQSEIKGIEKILSEVLSLSKWKKEDIYAVEVVGGSTRVPFVKNAIERVFGKIPNTTLNADEAVSRGCALQCAILSPTFKVREFSVLDSQPYALKLKWETGGELGEMEVFPSLQSIPFSKMLTFWQNSNFKLIVEYANPDVILNPHIGEFEIAVTPKADGSNTKVKVKARINLNGVFSIVSATTTEKIEVEEEVQMEVEETPSAKKDDKEDVNMEEGENGGIKKAGEEEETSSNPAAAAAAASPPKSRSRRRPLTRSLTSPFAAV